MKNCSGLNFCEDLCIFTSFHIPDSGPNPLNGFGGLRCTKYPPKQYWGLPDEYNRSPTFQCRDSHEKSAGMLIGKLHIGRHVFHRKFLTQKVGLRIHHPRFVSDFPHWSLKSGTYDLDSQRLGSARRVPLDPRVLLVDCNNVRGKGCERRFDPGLMKILQPLREVNMICKSVAPVIQCTEEIDHTTSNTAVPIWAQKACEP